MNEYRISDISIGLEAHFTKVITSGMMNEFLDITGDENPLHTDGDYAQNKGFSGRVVYGMLTASLISTLGGIYLPGKYCLIQSIEIKFTKPVFIGDELTVSGKVSRVDADLKYLEIKVEIHNQKNQKVLRGLLKVGVMDE